MNFARWLFKALMHFLNFNSLFVVVVLQYKKVSVSKKWSLFVCLFVHFFYPVRVLMRIKLWLNLKWEIIREVKVSTQLNYAFLCAYSDVTIFKDVRFLLCHFLSSNSKRFSEKLKFRIANLNIHWLMNRSD